MTIDRNKIKTFAENYTAAWNSGSAEAVAEPRDPQLLVFVRSS